jgi:hypothetical protein
MTFATGSALAWLRRAAPVVVIAGVSLFTLLPLLHTPLLGHDHPIHLFKAWQFFNEHLLHGRLRGWSHAWSLGYPAGEIVPCGGELWISLFRLVTFASLSWESTYKLAFAGMLFLSGFATYAFAKRSFGPVAGLVAGLLMLLDPGAALQGGWVWHTLFGVWPITLGCSFVALAYVKIEDVLDRAQSKDVVLAALYMGAALLAHQLSLVLLALALPLLLLDHWVRNTALQRLPWLRLVGTYALGFGLVAFSVLSLLARSDLTLDRGGPGEPVEIWGERLVNLELFHGGWRWISALGLVGAIRALRTRRRGGLWFVAASGLCFFFATDLPFRLLHAERVLPSLIKLESARMVMAAKIFWFPLAAYGATALASLATACLPRSNPRRWIAWLTVAIVSVPFAIPTVQWLYRTQIAKTFDREFSPERLQDFKLFTDWARAERDKTSDPYRIAFRTPSLDTLQSMSPMLTGTPAYHTSPTPSQHFNRFPCEFDEELFVTASVKYLVTDAPLANPSFVFERSFGNLSVYRFVRYNKDPFTVIGPGHGELLRFASERIDVRLTDTDSTSRLKLHVARHDRWRATQNGKTLAIRPAAAYDHEHPYLMEVDVGDGILTFEYVSRGIDWVGYLVTLLSVCVLGLLVFAPPSWRERFSPRPFVERHRAKIRTVVLATAVVGAGWLVPRFFTLRHMLPTTSLLHQVKSNQMTLAGHPCDKRGELDFVCGSATLAPKIVLGSQGVHVCMATDDRSSLTLDIATELGSALLFYYDPEPTAGEVKLSVGGESLGTVQSRFPDIDFRILHFDTHKFQGKGKVPIRLEVTRGPLRCFDLRLVSGHVAHGELQVVGP